MRKITRTTRHMSTNIEGLLRNMKGKKINFIEDDNGIIMTDSQARLELAALQAKGHKLIPSTDCEGFDPFAIGCPGHDIHDIYQVTYNEWKLLNEQSELMVNEDLNFEDIVHIDFSKSIIMTTENEEIGFDCLNEETFLSILSICS